MNVVVVHLSGDAARAQELLTARYDAPEITPLARSVLETGGFGRRLAAVRSRRPDVFAVITESVDWQYGQLPLMLFGALAGARESLIIDTRGGARSGTRWGLLVTSPFRIAAACLRGRLGVRRARRVLEQLEETIAAKPAPPPPNADVTAELVYLRATPAPGTQPGGASSHIRGVVKALSALGAKIRFISNDEIAALEKTDLTFERIAPSPDIMPRSAFDICNGLKFSESAVELIMGSAASLIYQRYVRFSYAGVETSLRARVPLFLEYNGSEVWIGRHWDKVEDLHLLERYERLNLAAADRIFVISDVERNNLLAAGVPAEKLVVNPNGVDTEEFKPGIGRSGERRELAIGPDTVLVGFVGSFGPWHGVLTLADAIALTRRDLDIRFLLIGDGSLRAEVQDRLKASGDLDRVIFTGTVAHDRVPGLLDACDILVSPHVPLADGSEFFGSPTKLFEYMAMGKGIVASRLGQIGEVLEDGVTAILVGPGNAKELSAAVERAATDGELRTRIGGAARAAAIARHTWRRNAQNILDEFAALKAR